MAGIRVVTDSACDLPENLTSELSIAVVPLTIRFGNEELVDRRDLTPEQFWARCRTSDSLPETAAPAPGAFAAVYRKAADDGCDGVVVITLSGELSATHQAAVTAATEAPLPVRVLDSQSITLGEGTVVLSAARAAAEGADLDRVTAVAEDHISRTRVFGTLDTLEYLKRGGRVGGAQALIGSMLSIKPILVIEKGQIQPLGRQRTRARALRFLVDQVREAGRVDNLAVAHGNAADVGQLIDMLAEVYPRDKIVVGDLGAVIGTHGGPGTIAIAYQTPA